MGADQCHGCFLGRPDAKRPRVGFARGVRILGQHVDYIGDDGNIHELVWDSGSSYHNNLTVWAGGVAAIEGSLAAYAFAAPLIQWLDRQAIRVEMCCASDLDDANALNFLGRYNLVVTVGHSRILVREHEAQSAAVHESGWERCLLRRQYESAWRVTSRPHSTPAPRKRYFGTVSRTDLDTELTGVSYEWWPIGDYPRIEFEVIDPGHWAFANTGLGPNNGFGQYDGYKQTVVGPETDRRQPTTPPSFHPLAWVHMDCQDADGNPAQCEFASVGIMTPGGTVFTAATMNWAFGLSQDGSFNPIDQITRNVLIRL